MRLSFTMCLFGMVSMSEARRQQKVVGTPFTGDLADADFIVEEGRVTSKLSMTESDNLRSTKVNESFKMSQKKDRSAHIPKLDEYFQIGSVFEKNKAKRVHSEVEKLMAKEKADLKDAH